VKPKTLRLNSFFAGIGGFDLGFERAGVKTSFQCELDEYCLSVLSRHWPKTERLPDIKSIDTNSIPAAQIWTGGFPCQDVSVARGWLGRDGLKGKNTGLFFPFAQLVKSQLPSVVLMENVVGLLSSHQGQDFSLILSTFNEMGYGVAWRILNTRYFGAPQSRPRVYICAWKGSATSAFDALYEAGSVYCPENPRLGFLREYSCDRTGAFVPEVAFCLAATSGRHTGTDWSRSYIAYHSDVRRLTPIECERLQGFPVDWTIPSGMPTGQKTEIDSLRYHAIGNAVSVPVVEWIANRIVPALKKLGDSTKTLATSRDHWSDFAHARTQVADFKGVAANQIKLSPLSSVKITTHKLRWGRGGLMSEGNCLTAPVSPSPNRPEPSRFVNILERQRPSKIYFLSPNAAQGILRRVESQNRQLFKPLDTALRRLARRQSTQMKD
jgi:DNA (cytosine-5)-methyltransferase 1